MSQLMCKHFHCLYLPALHKWELLPIPLIICHSDSRRLSGLEECSDNNNYMILQSFTAVFNIDTRLFSLRDLFSDPVTFLDSLRLYGKHPIKASSKRNEIHLFYSLKKCNSCLKNSFFYQEKTPHIFLFLKAHPRTNKTLLFRHSQLQITHFFGT